MGVLGRSSKPKLVACDTMNYWIQGKKAALLDGCSSGSTSSW